MCSSTLTILRLDYSAGEKSPPPWLFWNYLCDFVRYRPITRRSAFRYYLSLCRTLLAHSKFDNDRKGHLEVSQRIYFSCTVVDALLILDGVFVGFSLPIEHTLY